MAFLPISLSHRNNHHTVFQEYSGQGAASLEPKHIILESAHGGSIAENRARNIYKLCALYYICPGLAFGEPLSIPEAAGFGSGVSDWRPMLFNCEITFALGYTSDT